MSWNTPGVLLESTLSHSVFWCPTWSKFFYVYYQLSKKVLLQLVNIPLINYFYSKVKLKTLLIREKLGKGQLLPVLSETRHPRLGGVGRGRRGAPEVRWGRKFTGLSPLSHPEQLDPHKLTSLLRDSGILSSRGTELGPSSSPEPDYTAICF